MGLFGRKKEKRKMDQLKVPELPKLPELPSLPKLENFQREDEAFQVEPPPLPSYPSTVFGNKFSQNVIKGAVFGKGGGISEGSEDFEESEEDEGLQKLKFAKPEKPSRIERIFPSGSMKSSSSITESGSQIFVRLDKFEESLKIFSEIKSKVYDLEKMLVEIRKIKEKEDKELSEWESEIQIIKGQVEKVEGDLFSKLE